MLSIIARSLFFGGFSLILVIYLEFFTPKTAMQLSYLNQATFLIGSLIALLIYQPHFITTYFFNYSRGKDFLFKNKFIFIIFPILSIAFLLFSLLEILFTGRLSFVLTYKILLILSLIGASYHFAAQASAASFNLLSKTSPQNFKITKYILFMTAVFGFYQYICINHGSYRFSNMSYSFPLVPDKILTPLRTILILSNITLATLLFRKRLSWVPVIAFAAWFLAPQFSKTHFYLVPAFHSIQYLPFYFQRSGLKNYKFHALCLAGSIGLIFLLPNLINQNSVVNGTVFFVLILLFINLHHFLMESVSWKKTL